MAGGRVYTAGFALPVARAAGVLDDLIANHGFEDLHPTAEGAYDRIVSGVANEMIPRLFLTGSWGRAPAADLDVCLSVQDAGLESVLVITIIATLRFKPGMGAQFAAGFPAAAERVLGSETGTLLYKLVSLRDQPDTYRVVEFYESQVAVDVHMENLRKSPSKLGDLLAERPLIELHDDV